MKPVYWIGILALVGAVAAYAIGRWTGALDSAMGAVLGAVIGALVYSRRKKGAGAG